MWLKKLTLKNFQKHENLTLDFTPGVNVLYGHSDAGKSCIRRAIGFVFFGEPRVDATIRREGTKVTSVTALLDNGNEIERVKSASINRYVVRVPGQEELVYDSIGAEIPEEVQKVLQVKLVEIDQNSLNLNMAEQVSMPFLTDLPGSSRLKLFNKLTGNDVLDKVQGNINKEILNINKEIKNVKDIIETNKPKVENLTKEIDRRKQISYSLEASRLRVEKKLEAYQKLQVIKERLDSNLSAYNDTLADLLCIKEAQPAAIESLKSQIQTLTSLYSIQESFLAVSKELRETEATLRSVDAVVKLDAPALRKLIHKQEVLVVIKEGLKVTGEGLEAIQSQLAAIKVTEHDLTPLRGKIDLIKRLSIIGKTLTDNGAIIKQSFGEWNTLQMTIPKQEAEYKAILKEAGVCPVCKQDTSKCEAICNSTEKAKT
jgi:chromosome segregation ATPase